MAFRSLHPQSGRGRQAEARRNDLVVLEAARDVFAAQGADAPVSAGAARAGGVAGAPPSPRSGSKAELPQRLCVLAMEQALAAAGDALAAADPWDGLGGYIAACVELRSGALAALAGQIETTAEMNDTARRSMARLDELVVRAQAAGRLRADVTALDISWLIEQFSHRPPGLLADTAERGIRSRLIAIALDGLRARPGLVADGPESLPGPAPDRRAYVNRWSPQS